MKKISVAIAAYEMNGKGDVFLRNCINSIISQSHPNVEIVISDHSINDDLEKVCSEFPNIVYIKNANLRGSSSANFNNAIKHSSGDYIKILCQDDYLYGNDALLNTEKAFSETDSKWLVSPYYHTSDGENVHSLHYPADNHEYLPLVNRTGTHSCLTIRNDVNLLFDENLIWFMDCEYYSRLFNAYEHPVYIKDPTMVQTLWKGQVTNTRITGELVEKETNYIVSNFMKI
jgi:glycosyltransferase involved in cell wall biosynthesis